MLQLAGLSALGLLSACTGGGDGKDSPGAKGNEPDPDLALVTQAIAEKQELLDAYQATAAAFVGLAGQLGPLQLDHAAHRSALTRIQEQKAGGPVPTSAAPSASSSPTPSPVAKNTAAAIESLAAAETAAAGRRIGQCRNARDPELARLLASIGGSEAAHATELRFPVLRAGQQ